MTIFIFEKSKVMLISKVKQKVSYQLSNQFIRNIGWLGGAELINRVFRLGTTVVLARTLSPHDYGLAAIVLTTQDISNVFTLNSGVGNKIIHADEKDVEVLANTAYWLNWNICSLLFFLQCVAAFPIALFYQEQKLALPICTVGLIYLMIPVFSIQNAFNNRENKLKVTAICNALQSIIGNITAISFALFGLGMWSLVLPVVLTTPIWIVVNYKYQSWRPSGEFSLHRWQEIMKYGKDILGSEILDKIRANLDYFLIGRFLGVEALGLYFFAFNAGLGISLNVINAMVWPLFPHLCAARKDSVQFKNRYFTSLRTIALVIIPLVLLQSSLAPFYVPIVFSSKWVGAIPILVIICLSAIPRPFAGAAAMLLQAVDKGWINLCWSMTFTLIFAISLMIGMQWGSIGVATAVLITHVGAMPIFSIWATRYVLGKESL